MIRSREEGVGTARHWSEAWEQPRLFQLVDRMTVALKIVTHHDHITVIEKSM